jgi:transposase
MVQVQEVVPERRVRRWRSVSEKRQIVQLTLEPGASVAEVARAHGVNANQVFKWRRAFERGELVESCTALLPVSVATPSEPEKDAAQEPQPEQEPSGGSIHIEIPGRAMISVERGADRSLVRAVLESLQK